MILSRVVFVLQAVDSVLVKISYDYIETLVHLSMIFTLLILYE